MKDLRWKTISSEYLFKDSWFTIRRDTCEAADGKIISPYYVYEFPDWVTAVALTDDGQLVLERQYRHALGEVHFELPGGVVDPGDDSFESAIARELLEETGYQFDRFELLGRISANPSTNNNWMHMYLATGGRKVGHQMLDYNEEIEVHLFSPDQVKELLRSNQIVQSMHVTALFYAFSRLGWMSY
jgi:8-oxo-dGTP pyrophosphatase MutT (NUDIX family)